jgi:hypothetical protein
MLATARTVSARLPFTETDSVLRVDQVRRCTTQRALCQIEAVRWLDQDLVGRHSSHSARALTTELGEVFFIARVGLFFCHYEQADCDTLREALRCRERSADGDDCERPQPRTG